MKSWRSEQHEDLSSQHTGEASMLPRRPHGSHQRGARLSFARRPGQSMQRPSLALACNAHLTEDEAARLVQPARGPQWVYARLAGAC